MATYTQTYVERRVPPPAKAAPTSSARPHLLAPLGRALFAAIFIASAFGHFASGTIAAAAQQGVPMANILVPFSGIIAFLGGVSVMLGFRARLGAWLLIAFLLPVTFTMHNFWAIQNAALAQLQQAMFMKNLALIGGALLIAWFGAGPISLDARRRSDISGRF